MFRILGGDLVGMTNVPEVVLAREKGLCYSAIAVVTNYAAGISPNPLSHEEVLQEMRSSHKDLLELLRLTVRGISAVEGCRCSRGE
jgi:5'-methylthioadenosine phosphorylase